MEKLFVYGTLCPGRETPISWKISAASGWLARLWGFPVIQLDAQELPVQGYVFQSASLSQYWPMLDEFEAGYDCVPVTVNIENGEYLTAWIDQTQPA